MFHAGVENRKHTEDEEEEEGQTTYQRTIEALDGKNLMATTEGSDNTQKHKDYYYNDVEQLVNIASIGEFLQRQAADKTDENGYCMNGHSNHYGHLGYEGVMHYLASIQASQITARKDYLSSSPRTTSVSSGEEDANIDNRPPETARVSVIVSDRNKARSNDSSSDSLDFGYKDSSANFHCQSPSSSLPSIHSSSSSHHGTPPSCDSLQDLDSGSGCFSQEAHSNSESDEKRAARKRGRRQSDYVYNPRPVGKKSCRKFVSREEKDDRYWMQRLRNNQAAKKSREARRQKEIETLRKCSDLQKENQRLREYIVQLESKAADLDRKVQLYDKMMSNEKVLFVKM